MEHPGQFWIGTYPFRWSVFGWRQHPKAVEHGKIYFHDIGDYLSRDEKLEKIVAFGSIEGITKANGWLPVSPDQHNDWVGQRDDSFTKYMSLGDKRDENTLTIFENFSRGLETNRDAWCYHSSKLELAGNVKLTLNFYGSEVKRYKEACIGISKDDYPNVDDFVSYDLSKISWNRGLIPICFQ